MDAKALHRLHTEVELHADLLGCRLTPTPRRLGALAPRRPLAGLTRPRAVLHDGPPADFPSRHQNPRPSGLRRVLAAFLYFGLAAPRPACFPPTHPGESLTGTSCVIAGDRAGGVAGSGRVD